MTNDENRTVVSLFNLYAGSIKRMLSQPSTGSDKFYVAKRLYFIDDNTKGVYSPIRLLCVKCRFMVEEYQHCYPYLEESSETTNTH